ncbi:Gmad2 immunoglobulin-like domain-containing protein [Angustibacter luteus]|uniref:Gmad2 immunoglobulin-like domain-containing protein n=1 Tax=Angustibacter luteus TaxID=658456 RepID=A0ABW1JK52_9ACTN
MSDDGTGATPPQWLGDLPEPADDAAVAAVVDTLEHDASALQPGDRIAELRAATTARRERRPWLVAAAACTALVAVAGGGALALNGSGTALSPPTGHSTDVGTAPTVASPPVTGPRTTSSSAPSTASSGGGNAVAYALPVYYVQQDGDGLRLAREWHRRTLASPRQRMQQALDDATDPTAVQEAAHGAPWQPRTGPLRLEGPADGLLTIDLPATEGAAHGRSAAQARLAAQQLVWTATAVQQDASMGVRILIGGSPGLLFGSTPVGDAMFRDPAVGPTTAPASQAPSSQAPSGQAPSGQAPSGQSSGQQSESMVAIDSPRPQASLTAPLTVSGRACVFEAALSWELLSGAEVVRSGHLTASSGCPDTGAWSVRLVDVPAGQYTFRAYALPASGSGDPVQDTVAFTVR